MFRKVWNKRSKEELRKIIDMMGYFLLEDYFDNKNFRRVIVKDKIGYKYDIVASKLINSEYGIRFVDKSNPYSLENISLWLKNNNSEFELCDTNIYSGARGKLYFYHKNNECQELFSGNWADISRGRGCPICHGIQIGKRNSLSYLNVELSKEWHPENKLKPNQVTLKSGKSAYWICSKCGYGKNKEWHSRISHRTDGSGCPACSGLITTDRNRLSMLYPEIANEWDYEKNEDTPNDMAYASNKKRWWLCPRGHESYPSAISYRTSRENGCPTCANEQKESKIAKGLKIWCKEKFENIDIEHRMFRNPETNRWLWCDIYIGELNSTNGIYIEVHGQQHYFFDKYYHKTQKDFEDSKYRDKIKKKYARRYGRYLEIDLRKIKTTENAIEYILSKLEG